MTPLVIGAVGIGGYFLAKKVLAKPAPSTAEPVMDRPDPRAALSGDTGAAPDRSGQAVTNIQAVPPATTAAPKRTVRDHRTTTTATRTATTPSPTPTALRPSTTTFRSPTPVAAPTGTSNRELQATLTDLARVTAQRF